MELGCENMPVIVITRMSMKDSEAFAMKYKDMSPEELNTTFQRMGYDGVSGLDIRELKNFVQYRNLPHNSSFE